MRYDRDMRYGRSGPDRGPDRDLGGWIGRGEYGAVYEAPYRAGEHGYALGYAGGALRSRGSYEAGQLRSGLNPDDAFEFEWGEGYVGGRGYGGTNYDLEHGYRVTGIPRYPRERGAPLSRPGGVASSPATRGGYAWGEEARSRAEPYGPARYGYGPYFERLRRRPRPDQEIREEVEAAIFYDTWVDADRIDVSVEDGIVRLAGTLRSFDEVRYATDDAWDVDGVRGVRSDLEVREPGRSGRDEDMAGTPEAQGPSPTPAGAESAATEPGRAQPGSPAAVVQPERSRPPAGTQARSRAGGRRTRRSGTTEAPAESNAGIDVNEV